VIDSYFRNSFQKQIIEPTLKTPIVRLHPLVLTCFGLISGLVGSCFIYLHYPFTAVFFILLSGFLDILDGSLARKKNISSNIGAAMDLISDRLVEFTILFALFLLDPIDRGVLCFLMLGAVYLCVASFFIVSILTHQKSEKSFYYSPGIIERTEAFLFFILLILMPHHFFEIAIVFVILVGLTTITRLVQFCMQEISRNRHQNHRQSR